MTNRRITSLLITLTLANFLGCGGDDEPDLSGFPMLESVTLSLSEVEQGGSVDVIVTASNGDSATAVKAWFARWDGLTASEEVTLTGSGGSFSATVPIKADADISPSNGPFYLAIRFEGSKLANFHVDGDTSVYATLYLDDCRHCRPATTVVVPFLTVIAVGSGATRLEPNMAITASVDVEQNQLYDFLATGGVQYAVVLTPTSGNADLDVCNASPCDFNNGNLGRSANTGLTADTATFTPGADSRIYVNVHGVESSGYTLQVIGGGSGSPELSIVIDSVTNPTAFTTDMTFTVTNNGDGLAGPFKVMLWSNSTVAPTTASGQSGAMHDVTSLAAGASEQFTASGSGGTFQPSSAYDAYVLVDFFEAVTESDETNNVATLAWTAQ